MLNDWEQPVDAATAAIQAEAPPDSTETASAAAVVAAAEPSPKNIQVSAPVDSDRNIEPDQPVDQERQLLDAIYKQTIKVSMLGIEERRLASELEDLRSELSSAREMKTSLLNDLPDTLLQIRDGAAPHSASGDTPKTDAETDAVIKEAAIEIESAVGERPTESILSGIAGLGKGKSGAITDAFPTLAELESARAQAARSNKHFADMLPKGIGKRIADELTDRLITALAGNDTPASEQVKENQLVNQPISPTEPPTKKWSTLTARKLKETIDDGSCDSQCYPDAWRKGYDAFEENVNVETVDADLGDEPEEVKTEWIRGWLSAELNERQAIESQEAEEAEEAASEAAASDAPSNPSDDEIYEDVQDEGEPDDLERRLAHESREDFAEHVKSNGDTSYSHDKESWQRGYEASLDEQPLEACPPNLTDEQESDWIRGWVEGSLLEIV